MELSSCIIWIVIGLYLVVSALMIGLIPSGMTITKGATPLGKDDIDAIDAKNKVRQTIIQICGAFGFLFSIYLAITTQDSANKELKAKYDRESTELFVKAVESKSPQALYALTYVARQNSKNYYETIYQMLSSVIRSYRSDDCNNENKTAELSSKARVALRLLHERAENSDTKVRFNIEHSCLNDSDLSVDPSEWGNYRGLTGIRASGASMLRIDFTRTELQGAEFMGITAGDVHNPGWAQEPHRLELNELDDKGNPKYRAERRKYVAHFIDTNLTGATFNGAGLEGADFSGAKLGNVVFDGANISRVNFRGAQNLVEKQLLLACVDDAKSQPYLDEQLRSKVIVPVCQ